jgi:hypothetical protein
MLEIFCACSGLFAGDFDVWFAIFGSLVDEI